MKILTKKITLFGGKGGKKMVVGVKTDEFCTKTVQTAA